jgi:NAD(P)-dependent dehydrogenase (short-subunit alcohol dehydrogenase family)
MSSQPPVAVVTGAARGIGRATAVALAKAGMVVVGADIGNGEDSQAELMQLRPGSTMVAADISAASDVARVATVAAGRGDVHAVVNAAGILSVSDVVDTDEDEWDRVFAVNVKGTYLISRAIIPLLRAAGGGAIVNISSVHALATVERCAAYAATKGAVLALSRQMAIDYAADGIRVIPLIVGSVDTEMSSQHAAAFGLPPGHAEPGKPALGRMAAPDEIASVIRFLVSSDAAFVTGSPMVADGGLLTHL